MRQVWQFRMHALIHIVGSVVVVPYVALALFFIFIGQLTRTKGILSLIETIWNNFFFYFTKGMFVAPVILVCLVVMGFIPVLQRAGSLCLCVLAVASLLVVVILPAQRLGLGELLFLVPCMAVAASSAWLFFRA